VFIYDSDGNAMLDGMSGLWCCNLGYSQDAIKQAVFDQMQQLPYYNNFFKCSNQPAVELAGALTEVAPPGFEHVFFTNSGSEANDTNIAWCTATTTCSASREKKLIISRKNAYHGSTIAAASLGGMKAMHEQAIGLDYVHHINQPHWFESAARKRIPTASACAWRGNSRSQDRRTGRGPRRRLHRRARAGRRRRDHSAGQLLARAAAHLRRARHPADRRRGDLRLRAHGQLVGQPDLRPSSPT
jgi:4-aminobutyrate aminotransferase-like enzyme